MVEDNFRVEVIGHATLRVQCGGRTLLTDPWLVDPIVGGSGFHFPPLVHDPAALAAETDAIFVSHAHPDHFNPRSLGLFDRETPVYVGDHRRKALRDGLRGLGFRVVEVPFGETVRVDGTDIRISIIAHDGRDDAAHDSSILIRTPAFTLFENNDCFLRPETYAALGGRSAVDYAFLGYSPASFFPICFELDADEKARLLREAADRRYDEFVRAARLLGAGLAVPFASGLRFLHRRALWKNVSFNSASEAVRRARAAGLTSEVMGPGDRIDADGSIRRRSPVLERDEELAAIAAHARDVEGWVAEVCGRETPARSDIVEQFRDYMLARWHETRRALPDLRGRVIAYVLHGASERRFYFDFSRPDDQIFQWGEPSRYDMRYTYPAGALQQTLDGDLDWDELHFTNDVSVHQVRYAPDLNAMLRSETGA